MAGTKKFADFNIIAESRFSMKLANVSKMADSVQFAKVNIPEIGAKW